MARRSFFGWRYFFLVLFLLQNRLLQLHLWDSNGFVALPFFKPHKFYLLRVLGMNKLNRIQSKMCDVALRSSENILLCAPTGAGKTNVACLTMLNILGQHRKDDVESGDESDGGEKSVFDLQSFKIVYIAPMKALVQEQVKNFRDRLADFGVVVNELSGDSSLTRQQISETQLLVTTPEKFDIVTRQGEGRSYSQLIKLVMAF